MFDNHDNLQDLGSNRDLGAKVDFVPKVVWMSLTASIFFISMMPPVLQQGGEQMADALDKTASLKTWNPIFIGLSAWIAMAALFIYFYLLSDDQLKRFAAKSLAPMAEPLRLQKAKSHVFVLYIISWALNETIANLGLIQAKLSGDSQTTIYFGSAAIILNLMMAPKLSDRVRAAMKSII